jgi:hypothetical protein
MRGFLSDLNLFWDVSGEPVVGANGHPDQQARWVYERRFTLEEIHALGYDRHSLVMDPRCQDMRRFDFTLSEDSPAIELGFQPIDLSNVGPRPKDRERGPESDRRPGY